MKTKNRKNPTGKTGKALRKALEKIAKECLDIPTLETRKSDGLDFHTVAVWSVEASLRKALIKGIEIGWDMREKAKV